MSFLDEILICVRAKKSAQFWLLKNVYSQASCTAVLFASRIAGLLQTWHWEAFPARQLRWRLRDFAEWFIKQEHLKRNATEWYIIAISLISVYWYLYYIILLCIKLLIFYSSIDIIGRLDIPSECTKHAAVSTWSGSPMPSECIRQRFRQVEEWYWQWVCSWPQTELNWEIQIIHRSTAKSFEVRVF